MVRLGTTKENWTTRDGDQGWAGWRTIRGFTGRENWNQPLKWRETASIQGRVGSRPNGGIWRDDLDQLGQLLCWIVAEVLTVEWCTFVCKGIDFGAKSRWYGRKLADPRWFGCARGLIHGNGRLEYGPLSSSPGDTYKVDNPFTSWQWHVFKVIYRRVSSKMVRWVVLGCTQVGKQVCIRPSSPPPRPRPRPRVFFSSKPPLVNDMISLLWKETWLYLLSFHEYIIF